MRRVGCLLVLLALAGLAYLFAREYARRYPQDVPWTELDLEQPIGAFTGRKLAALGDEPQQCRALLRNAQVRDVMAAPRSAGPQCGYADGMRLASSGRTTGYRPAGPIVSCPVAAALAVWERQVLQWAAIRHFRSRVVEVRHFGSYSCRRLYGRGEGPFSEHATADAIDIAGFRLADGTEVSVLRDWTASGPKADFLHEVRDGACKLFSTVLSPDYNAAHADHLHFDQAERGAAGWRMCR